MIPMKCRMLKLVLAAALLTGCSQQQQATKSEPSQKAGSQYLMAAEPSGAREVLDVLREPKDEQQIVVVGRIGGDVNPWIDDMAAFSIVDRSLKPCNEIPGDTCETPWDYCCEADLGKAKTLVKIVDEQGNIVPIDARKLLNVKELETIFVRGRTSVDDAGNVTVVAKQIFIKR